MGTFDPIMLLSILFLLTMPNINNIAAGQEFVKMVKHDAIQLLMPFILELEDMFLFHFVAYFNSPYGEEEHCI
jgi:hypothetical protein